MAKKRKQDRRGLGSTDSDELLLYIDNDAPSVRRKQAMFTNLTKHVCRGNFTKSSAAKLMKYLVDDAGKQYMKEFGTGGNFSVADRKEAANELVKEYLSNLKDCTKRGPAYCGDLPNEAVAILKKPRCTPGGELSRVHFKRRMRD